jgi:hypothetical protein
MKKIGLMSDTHGFMDPDFLLSLSKCDEIWHAGDIGGMNVVDDLESLNIPIKAVYGNIDDFEIRSVFPMHNRFQCEGIDVWITHIGGYPGNYAMEVKNEIHKNPPKLFISGHSHILKIMFDKSLDFLHINPGAAGKSGIHQVRTYVEFIIDNDDIRDIQIIEKKRQH